MKILTNTDELKTICSPVESLEEAEKIVFQLEQSLKESADAGRSGIGLAAPQIGIFKNVAIIRIGDLSLNLANHVIREMHHEFIFDGEGCLSFPDLVGKTKRFKEIFVEENLFKPHRFIMTGVPAVVVQHETDHLFGRVLPDFKL